MVDVDGEAVGLPGFSEVLLRSDRDDVDTNIDAGSGASIALSI